MFRKINTVNTWSLGKKAYCEPKEEEVIIAKQPYSGPIDSDDEPVTMESLINEATRKKISMNKLRKIFGEMSKIGEE